MPSCLIGLGANLGNRRRTLQQAVSRLSELSRVLMVRASSWYETSPVGGPPEQPPFLNGAAVVETRLPPQALLDVLKQIEADLGRRPSTRWAPRPIDLDLLLYDRLVLQAPSLVLPHPRMAWRRFVLQPAAEVAGSMIHPTTGWTIAQLLHHLDTAIPYVAVAGAIGAGKTDLARRLSERTSARLITEPRDPGRPVASDANRAGHGWASELEFLRQRTRLLAVDAPVWADRQRWVVSDFWLDQSLALARLWLPPEQRISFRRHFGPLSRRVVRPKLLVLLDVPADRLWQRVTQRRGGDPWDLSEEQLEQIRQSIFDQATRPGQGPLLQLTGDDPEAAVDEVRAAMDAMEQGKSGSNWK